MSKPFFFRIESADLLNFATDPEGEGMSLLKFAKELQKGESEVEFIQGIIDEAYSFKSKKAKAGKAGAQKKWGEDAGNNKYGKTRSERLTHARSLGTHTDIEWEYMKFITDYICVRCNEKVKDDSPTKDHIIPISLGGSDAIENIQPVCRQCNSSKNDDIDSRPIDWKRMHSKCMANGYQVGYKCMASSSTEAVTETITEPKTKYVEEDLRLAEWIFDLILVLDEKAKKPDFNKWADTIRLMVERDKFSRREIAEVFKWANGDSFWKKNILSPTKLREKFSQLKITMGSNKTNPVIEKIESKEDWLAGGFKDATANL